MSDQRDLPEPGPSNAILALDCLRLAAGATVPGVGPLATEDVVERAKAYFDFVSGAERSDDRSEERQLTSGRGRKRS